VLAGGLQEDRLMNGSRVRSWLVASSAAVLCVGLCGACQAFGLPKIGDVKVPSLPKAEKERAPEQEPEKPAKTPTFTGPKKRLAVMDMEVKIIATAAAEPTTTGGIVSTTSVSIPPPSDFGSGLTEMLTTALVESGRFIVLERKGLADIEAELMLAASGSVDPTSAPRAGKLLGAQVLVRGAVTEYAYTRSSTGGTASFLEGIAAGVDVASSKAQASVVLDVRVYEVATGQIMDSVKAEGRASSSAVSLGIDREDWSMATAGFSQTPLGQASRKAIEGAVKAIIDRTAVIPWEGRVAAVDPETGPASTIYINAGTAAGLKVGDRFEVLEPGREIVDPETRVVIGRAKDTMVGKCQIESLTSSLSCAVPLEGEAFAVGDVVRMIAAKAEAGEEAEG
jgi:curli biogenesis system outer membrane secretion channel CsgG